MPASPTECLVSVDLETAGPVPGRYSMLSLGACLVDDPTTTFYVELKPLVEDAVPAALEVSGLSMGELARTGAEPAAAMRSFADWVAASVPPGQRPVFVGFNASFDWMFAAEYFDRFGIENPFGHSALDIKAYRMGQSGSSWAETSMEHLSALFLGGRPLSHNALDDARDQAELFRAIRDEGRRRYEGRGHD